jgi:hypothetical protein
VEKESTGINTVSPNQCRSTCKVVWSQSSVIDRAWSMCRDAIVEHRRFILNTGQSHAQQQTSSTSNHVGTAIEQNCIVSSKAHEAELLRMEACTSVVLYRIVSK